MDTRKNTKKNNSSHKRQNGNSWCDFKYVSEIVNSISLFCSFVGIGLIGAIFFGLADMLDYRSSRLVSAFAHYMVVVAVILFLFALLLSLFHEDSEKNNAIVPHRATVRGRAMLESNHSEDGDTAKLVVHKLKCTDRSMEVEPSNIVEAIKPANISSKQGEIEAKTLDSNISHINSQLANMAKYKNRYKSPPSSTSLENPQHADISKHRENTTALSSNISSENSQHASPSKQRGSKALPLNITSENLQNVGGTSNQRISSPNISSETLHSCTSKQGTLRTKPQSPNLNESCSHADKQLVPYERQLNSSYGERIQTVFTPPISNICNSMSTNSLENRPAAEIIATKTMTIFPGGVTREEYRVTKTSFYNCIWCPLGKNLENSWCPGLRMKSESVLGPNQNNPWGAGGSTSSGVLGKNLYNNNRSGPTCGMSLQGISRPNFDSSWYPGNRISPQSALRSNLGSHSNPQTVSSLVLHQPLQNKVSDVRSKFESMNILP